MPYAVGEQLELHRLRVLVVDDDKHMCGLIKTMLHAGGVRLVKTAMDAAEAFNELRFFPADAIITDLNMKPLDGIEFTRLIRTSEDMSNREIPIIMLTGHPELRWVNEAKRAGVSDFLSKPVSIERLHSRLKRALGRESQDSGDDATNGAALSQAEVEALLNC